MTDTAEQKKQNAIMQESYNQMQLSVSAMSESLAEHIALVEEAKKELASIREAAESEKQALGDLAAIRDSIASQKAELSRIGGDISAAKREHGAIAEANAELKGQNALLESEKNGILSEISTLNASQKEALAAATNAKADAEALNKQILRMRSEISDRFAENLRAKNEAEAGKEYAEQLSAQIEELVASIAQKKSEYRDASARVADITGKISAKQAELAAANSEMEKAKADHENEIAQREKEVGEREHNASLKEHSIKDREESLSEHVKDIELKIGRKIY